MRFAVLLRKSRIVIFLIFILNLVILTSGKQGSPVISNDPLTSDEYEVKLTLIDELDVGGGAKDIEIVENIAYVLSDSGLDIYNIADPKNANRLGYYYADGYLGHSIALYNNYVFAAADNQGLIIIDVNDPSNPSLANTISSTRPAAVYIHTNMLFVANWNNDFEIYNLTNTPSITEVTRFEGEGFSYVYAKDDLSFGFANNGSLLILDISDPEKIEIRSQIDDEELRCITIDGNLWYAGGSNGIKVFNSSNITNPVLVSHFTETEESSITNLMILNSILYVSDYHLGFRVFNVSNPATIFEIGQNDAGGSPLGFQVDDQIAYVASQIRGIQIVKIHFSDPKSTFLDLVFILPVSFLVSILSRKRSNRKKSL
jgi:hypothetical protein